MTMRPDSGQTKRKAHTTMWNATLKRSIALALVLALFLVALSACGGESDDGASSPEPVQQPVVSSTTAPAQEPTAASQPAAEPTAAVPADTPEPAAMERKLGEVDGVTFIVGEGSEATFTVGEVLARVPLPIEAVMRTEQLSGEIHLDGRESRITIDLQTLESDQANRDRWARGRLFGQHPTGVFILTDATPLPDGFAEGETVTTQITGSVELLGQTIPMTFDIEARDDGDLVLILGKATFTWADIGVATPSSPAVVSVEDEVRVNVLITARPQ